jgi:uncharacterized protein (TIGR02594 family)
VPGAQVSMLVQGAPLAVVPTDPVWMQPFLRWSAGGALERAGSQDNPLIVEMLALAGLPHQHDETPWCSAAMNAAMYESGLRGTGRANARSWEAWGEKLAKPRIGCVAVLWRDTPSSGHGHVALWLGDVPGSQMVLLGGNQANAVSVQLYPRGRLLSYRWPDDGCLVGA